ncbi:MAG: hypothetical protein AB8G22_06175, partial [Saprospiraceae bacterium]
HIPMGNSLVFLGNGIKSDLENLINYFHQHNDYADIDLNLIKSLGLNLPAEPVAERWIVDSGKLIEPIPIDIPQGYQYEMTNDGVGVLAPKEAFLENPIIGKWTETNKSLEKVTSFIENKPATALVVLKNVLYELYHSPIDVVHSLKETLVLSEMAYRNLRKIELAERVRELITEINTE